MSDSSVSFLSSNNEVAEHYNRKPTGDLLVRSQSRIYFLRNFNNWIKSVLISEFLTKLRNEKQVERASVLDLGCGRGGDILKWKKGRVARVTFCDIAEISLQECKSRYQDAQRSGFQAEFVHLDASIDLVSNKISCKENLKHDLVSSQFVIHYSYESFEKANHFLRNVSESLSVGGFFIGTTTNDFELIKRLRKSDDFSFGNEIYNIKFLNLDDKNHIDLFGVKFDFQLDNVVECPEFLLNFEAFKRIAARHGLKFLFKKTFREFFDEHAEKRDYKELISIMNAMEPYYTSRNYVDPKHRDSVDYEHINKKLESDEEFRNGLNSDETYATLSKSEWDVASLYLTFAFEKVDAEELKVSSDSESSAATNKQTDDESS
jgi:mRNA (guanine-N7-)-methyltransferase